MVVEFDIAVNEFVFGIFVYGFEIFEFELDLFELDPKKVYYMARKLLKSVLRTIIGAGCVNRMHTYMNFLILHIVYHHFFFEITVMIGFGTFR